MSNLTARALPFRFLRKWGFCRTYLTHIEQNTSNKSEFAEENADEDVNAMIHPLKHPDFFQVHKLFTVQDLFNAKVHYGHKEGSLNDKMRPFIFGTRLDHLIINLDETAILLRQALNFAAHIAFRGGIILFISRNPQTYHLVEKTAKECQEYSHTRYWAAGTFTNSTAQFKAQIRLPDLCIFINTLDTVMHQHLAVTHAAKMCIPTIGIVDTNCDPNLITYPVPGNDDSPSAVELYCKLFKEAILRGKTGKTTFAKFQEYELYK